MRFLPILMAAVLIGVPAASGQLSASVTQTAEPHPNQAGAIEIELLWECDSADVAEYLIDPNRRTTFEFSSDEELDFVGPVELYLDLSSCATGATEIRGAQTLDVVSGLTDYGSYNVSLRLEAAGSFVDPVVAETQFVLDVAFLNIVQIKPLQHVFIETHSAFVPLEIHNFGNGPVNMTHVMDQCPLDWFGYKWFTVPSQTNIITGSENNTLFLLSPPGGTQEGCDIQLTAEGPDGSVIVVQTTVVVENPNPHASTPFTLFLPTLLLVGALLMGGFWLMDRKK